MKYKILLSTAALLITLIVEAQSNWTTYTDKDDIYCMALDNDIIWIGTDGGVVCRSTNGEFISQYTKSDGLASNKVSAMVIDDQGNKWFAAYLGVNKFDNKNWTTYDLGGSVISIFKDSQGNIWVGTGNAGAFKFDGANWTNFNISNSGLANNYVSSISEDHQGGIWFGSYQHGLTRFDGEKWTVYNTNNSVLKSNNINTITVDSKGRMWFGTDNGVCKLNGNNWEIYDPTNSGLSNQWVHSITEDLQGNIWIGSLDGIDKFDGSNWTSFDERELYSLGNTVNSIIIDRQGNKWFGTSYHGLSKFDDSNWTEYSMSNLDLCSSFVNSIACDADENIWFGTVSNITKFDGDKFTTYTTANSGLVHWRTNSIVADKQGDIWIGTDKGVSRFDNVNWTTYNSTNSGLQGDKVYIIAVDEQGNKWFGTDNGLYKFNGVNWTSYSSKLPSRAVHSIHEDTQGNLWFGTYLGACKFDGTTWTTYTTTNSGLTDNNITAISTDTQGNAWFGTYDKGVSKFDGTNWTVFNKTNSGLADNQIQCIYIDANNIKWFGTSGGGISKFDGNSWTTYNLKNSALGILNIKSIIIDAQGNKLIATADGAFKFDDDGIGSLNSVMPKFIHGSVFNDLNGNGIKDAVEPFLPYKYTKVLNDSSIITTQDDGKFCIARTNGYYQIKFIPCRYWQPTTDSIISFQITDTTKQINGIDFGIKMLSAINDVSVDLGGGIARAGFHGNWWLTYKNDGTQAQSGEVTLEIDPLVEFENSNPAPNQQNGNRLTWNYSNLVSFEKRQISLYLKMPDVSYIGDSIISKAIINPYVNDTFPSNNNYVLKQVLTGSYDPNDKTVDIGSNKAGNTFNNEEHIYTIRFQNTGNDTAFNVVIKDTISHHLNIETFRLVSSSHEVEVDIKNKNVISYIFHHIKLPDDKVNESASHGFVKFAIMPFFNLAENIEVTNTGYIYFDYNPAIVTNEVKTIHATGGSATLLVSPDKLNLEAVADSTTTFDISSNTNWTIACNQSWLTVSIPSGSNNATIRLNAAANPTSGQRIATITISVNGVALKTIIVTQKATLITTPYLTVAEKTLTIGAPSNSLQIFEISSNINWTVFVNQSWLKISKSRGSGNSVLTLTALQNPSTSTRTAEVRVRGNGMATHTILVVQDPTAAFLTVSCNALTFEAEPDSSQSVDIGSNIAWSAENDQQWLKAGKLVVSDNGIFTLTLSALPNPTPVTRTALLTFSGTGVNTQTITVTQYGGVTGLFDNENTVISIYPNPATSYVMIENTNLKSARYLLKVLDVQGRDVILQNIEFPNAYKLDLSKMDNGMYFIMLQNDNERLIQKILLQK